MRIARFAAALAAAAAIPALAGAVDDFLAFSAGTRSATARFEQKVFDRDGRTVETASGTFAFSRPGRFRWAYDPPARQLLVGDGTRLWIHDPDLNQVTVRTIDKAISATPAALLAGNRDVTAVFTLSDGGAADGLAWVVAVPRERDTGFERVRLGLRGGSLAAMELHDALGGRTMLRFTDLRANARLAPEAFRFVPPAGADVLDESAAAKR